MDMKHLERILAHTLEDAKMSRGEKQVLRRIVDEMELSPHEIGVVRSKAFDMARAELTTGDEQSVLGWLEEVVKVLVAEPVEKPRRACEAYFTPGDNGPRKIASLISFARKSIDICVFTITDDRISDEIEQSHRRGVQVRIISDNDKALDPGSDIGRLGRYGVEVRVDRTEHHMHHKFAVFDNATTLTGSYNWTRSAAEYNAENFILSYDPQLAREFTTEFERLWKEFA